MSAPAERNEDAPGTPCPCCRLGPDDEAPPVSRGSELSAETPPPPLASTGGRSCCVRVEEPEPQARLDGIDAVALEASQTVLGPRIPSPRHRPAPVRRAPSTSPPRTLPLLL